LRLALARIFEEALGELDLAQRVHDALPARLARPARVVAIGKAAPAMAAGALSRWGDAIERCLVVAPDDTDLATLNEAAARADVRDRLVVMRAAHPLPDARSVRAGKACLEAVTTAARCEIVVLVSGGASALACVPAPGVTLAAKRAITRAMLASGAPVQDINVVRKHLSLLKGGGLARAGASSRIRTLVASDVIGGSASDVGSGPSVPDTTTVRDARRLLRRFAPSFADVPLVKTYAPPAARAKRLRAKTIASPEELARVFAALLRQRGMDVRLLPPSQAPVAKLASAYAALARRGAARVFVRVAEPSVEVTAGAARAGRGGRSTHVAALVGCALRDLQTVPWTFAAFATDGVDGGSGTGGAIVDSRLVAGLRESALDRAVAAFDTGTLLRALGAAVPSRPTGHNLADLHVLVVG
jgi:hydroxypyruvate reductase